MNKITTQITAMMQPKAALIAYENSEEKSCFLELRTINDKGQMSEGMPVTYDFMNSLAENFSQVHNGTPYGILPDNLLYADSRKGREKYIWHTPPQRRMMYFKQTLHIENAEYNLPGVVYVVANDKMEIYAYKGDKPDERTELFAAPFFNVSGASVCLGSANLEKPTNPTYTDLLDYWEKRFWLTEFSHLGSGGNPTKSNLVLVTKAAHDAPFNLDELKPLNKTLKTILR